MNSPKRSSVKREKLPQPDLTTYSNNMESAQYQVVGGKLTENKCYRSEGADDMVEITGTRKRDSGSKCKFGYPLIFALSIAVSIGATAFLTYYFLKVHYEDCLTKDDLPRLQQTQVLRPPRDCKEHYDYGALVDGIYRIHPGKTVSLKVWCDMGNGGWTILQKRTKGTEDFDRDWQGYVDGFGNISEDHWIGLKYQHLLTDHENQYQISFQLLLTDTNSLATAVYDSFFVGNEETNFTMLVTPSAEYNDIMEPHVDSRNIFFYHSGMQFTTRDSDHDERPVGSCVEHTKCGGFWYKNCHMICMHGRFDRMYFFEPANMQNFFSQSVIKIRPFS